MKLSVIFNNNHEDDDDDDDDKNLSMVRREKNYQSEILFKYKVTLSFKGATSLKHLDH